MLWKVTYIQIITNNFKVSHLSILNRYGTIEQSAKLQSIQAAMRAIRDIYNFVAHSVTLFDSQATVNILTSWMLISWIWITCLLKDFSILNFYLKICDLKVESAIWIWKRQKGIVHCLLKILVLWSLRVSWSLSLNALIWDTVALHDLNFEKLKFFLSKFFANTIFFR